MKKLLATLVFALVASHAFGQTLPTPNVAGLKVNGVSQSFPASGNLVGTTDSQTLSGKTIASGIPTGNWLSAGGTLVPNTTYQCGNAQPANVFGFSGTGASLSVGSGGGCIPGDTIHSQDWLVGTTQTSYTIGEYFSHIEMNNTLGAAGAWKASTVFPANSSVHGSGSGTDQIYFSAAGGTSGVTSPTCTSGTCSDGGITWTWRTNGFNDGKTAQFIAAIGTTGGHMWGQAIASTIPAGSGFFSALPGGGGFSSIQELDIANGDKDCPPGATNACQSYGLFMAGIASPGIANAVGILGGGSTNPLYHWGVALLGGFAKDIGISEATNATVGIQQSGTNSSAGITSLSTTPVGLNMTGSYSTAGISMTGATLGSNAFQSPGFSVNKTGAFSAVGDSLINNNAAAAPAAIGSGATALQLNQADGFSSRVGMYSYASFAAVDLVRAQGSGASPTALTNNITIGNVNWWGYDAAATLSAAARASLASIATEDWSASANGTRIRISATKNTTTTTSTVADLDGYGHALLGLQTVPTITSCGTSPSAARGTDMGGEVTEGTTATGCTITFANAFTAAPFCTVTTQSQLVSFAYAISTSAITVTNTSGTGDKIDWSCNGQ